MRAYGLAICLALLTSTMGIHTQAREAKEDSCPFLKIGKPLGKVTTVSGRLVSKLTIGRKNRLADAPAQFHARGKSYLANSEDAVTYFNGLRDQLQEAWVATGKTNSARPAFYLSNDRQYQAEAMFDHGIIVNIGAIDKAETDDEMAFLVAHELAHVLLGHTDDHKSIERSLGQLQMAQRAIDYAAELARMTVADTATVDAATSGDSAESARKAEEAQQEIERHNRRVARFVRKFQNLSEKIARPAWSAKQEDEADAMAVELMLRAGYSFFGVVTSLLNMQEAQQNACAELVELQQDLEDYRAKLDSYEWVKYVDTDFDTAAWKEMLKPLKKKSKKTLRDALMAQALPQTHRPWDERIAILKEYKATDKIKQLVAVKPPGDGKISRVHASERYQQTVDSAIAISEFEKALKNDDLAGASGLIASIDMQTSHGRLLKHELRLEQRKRDDAFENLRLAMRLETPALRVYELFLAGLLQRGEFAEAAVVVEAGRNLYGDHAYFLPEDIYLAVKRDTTSGNSASSRQAKQLMSECRKTPRKELHDICKAARFAVSTEFRKFTAVILEENSCTWRRIAAKAWTAERRC